MIAIPTETVYGLAVDATSDEGVAKVYALKSRPSFNPLIAHIPDLASAQQQGLFNDQALALAKAFWPGPLTLVVPVAPTCTIGALARAGLETVGLRVPDHPLTLDLLRRLNVPLAAPSANRSGKISPTCAEHVRAEFGDSIEILDGGPCRIGVESTIVACLGDSPAVLLRPGGLAREAIEEVLGTKLLAPASPAITAPGMLTSHYAPDAKVRLNATSIQEGEAALLFGPLPLPGQDRARMALNLSESADLVEAAANLFAFLRRLDESGASTIAVAPIPETGLGEAINDRLRRAAAER